MDVAADEHSTNRAARRRRRTARVRSAMPPVAATAAPGVGPAPRPAAAALDRGAIPRRRPNAAGETRHRSAERLRAPSGRRRGRLVAAALTAAALSAGAAGAADPPAPALRGRFIVAGPAARASALVEAGRTAQPLGQGPAPFGTIGPMGVPSPDGETIVYGTVAPETAAPPADGDVVARPALRVRTLRTGDDRVLDDGASLPAWSPTGELAYFKGDRPEMRSLAPFVGHVVVRRRLDAAPEVWTRESDRYQPLAWAGARLLLYRTPTGAEAGGDLFVADGPASARPFTDAPGGFLAVSPDGTLVLVGGIRTADGSLALALVDAASGLAAGTVVADVPADRPVTSLGPTSWVDDTVVVGGAVGEAPALLVFGWDAAARRLALAHTIPLAGRRARSLPVNVYLTANRTRAAATYHVETAAGGTPAHRGWRHELADCAIAEERCAFSVLPHAADRQLGRVFNPSRPLPRVGARRFGAGPAAGRGLAEEDL